MIESIPVTLKTGRKVELRELNGLQQVRADMCVPEEAPSSVSVYYRVAMATTKIDGTAAAAAGSRLELEARMAQFSGAEMDELVNAYYAAVRSQVAQLPKTSAPEDDKPSS